MHRKAPTGIAILDKELQGGIPRSRGYLIVGGPFSSKEIFCMQILYESLKRGEPCIYISFTKTYKRIREDFYGLNYGLFDPSI